MEYKKVLMLTILKNNQWDCPQEENKIYFNSLEEAREAGIDLLQKFNSTAFRVNRLTGDGHYRTMGYFNQKGEVLIKSTHCAI